MSDKTRSKRPIARHYADAMEVLEHQNSEAVVPIREYVRSLREEAHKYRVKARDLKQQLEEETNGR